MFRISDKTGRIIITKMLNNLHMVVGIKKGKTATTPENVKFYPIIEMNVKENTIKYKDGEMEKIIKSLKVVGLNFLSDDPTIIVEERE